MPVKTKLPRVVKRQRVRLRWGSARLFFESKTTVHGTSPLREHGLADDLAVSAYSFEPQVQALGLLLHLGHEGLGRAIALMNGRGFVDRLIPLARPRAALGLRIGQRALVMAGLVIDAWQVAKALQRSLAAKSARPVTAQAARSLTTWGAIWAGVELFGTGGALMGIELGPGVVVTSVLGATVGGCVGFFAGNWVAEQIDHPASPGLSET
jgi:hypothetical protein